MKTKAQHGEHGEGTEDTEKSSVCVFRGCEDHLLNSSGFLRVLRAFSVSSVFQP
jgi:hypothetical protein